MPKEAWPSTAWSTAQCKKEMHHTHLQHLTDQLDVLRRQHQSGPLNFDANLVAEDGQATWAPVGTERKRATMDYNTLDRQLGPEVKG
jgi:hypothetical protein